MFDIPKGKNQDIKFNLQKLSFTNQRRYKRERMKTKGNNNKSFLMTPSTLKIPKTQKTLQTKIKWLKKVKNLFRHQLCLSPCVKLILVLLIYYFEFRRFICCHEIYMY